MFIFTIPILYKLDVTLEKLNLKYHKTIRNTFIFTCDWKETSRIAFYSVQ